MNAVTYDVLPSYDILLVPLSPTLESILPRTAPEQPNAARIFFLVDTLHGNRSYFTLYMILSGAISFHLTPPHHIVIGYILILLFLK
jgi:hypothetical protein